MSRLEAVANVALRVPALALLELLYRGEPAALGELLRAPRGHAELPPLLPPLLPLPLLHPRALRGAYCLGHVLCVVLLALPVRSLVRLYLHVLTVLLLCAGHRAAGDYVRRELEHEARGAGHDAAGARGRLVGALAGPLGVCALCSLLPRRRRPWRFAAPLLPVAARLCGCPAPALPALHRLAAALSALLLLRALAAHALLPLRLAAAAGRELAQARELSRLLALGTSLWSRLAVPLLFLVFWLVLFALRLVAHVASPGGPVAQQGLLFVLLSSAAECCSTPYSLVGLTFTVSYVALGVLNLCKFYLLGFGAFHHGNVMHRGVTEGVTLLLLALQTGLLDLQVLQRTFLLSIILFIVVTSTLQSMIEIADPIVLALGASRNRSPWRHFRGVSMCLFLLVFPCFMAYKIAHFFHLDFWLLILVSSCMLTSLQVMGTLFIYALFVVELFQDAPLERMDEIIYCVTAVSRVLEFLVAVCVVGYGTWESLFGEWSWMGASVIIIHSYFNVWLRAQSGWKSFLLRREAARKISSLPRATRGQLRDHGDVCAICFQDMQVAVVTPCRHFFHGACLRKWLYVQDTCPMCHQRVQPAAAEAEPGAGAAVGPDREDEVPEEEEGERGQPERSPPEPAQPAHRGLPPAPAAAPADTAAGHGGGAGAGPEPCGAEPPARDTQTPAPAAACSTPGTSSPPGASSTPATSSAPGTSSTPGARSVPATSSAPTASSTPVTSPGLGMGDSRDPHSTRSPS